MKSNLTIKEFCAENFTDIPRAVAAGANRIELCDNLAAGGTTPSYGVIRKTTAFAQKKNVAVMTMIRPRGGDFQYNTDEADVMLDDLSVCARLGSDGVVFGCLKDGWIDESLVEKLITAAGHMAVTFHMAFDELSAEDQFRAIDWLAERKVARILTHGGSAERTIEENLPHLKALVTYAAGRLMILPGGGIRYTNVARVTAELGVHEAHGTKIVDLNA